MATVASPLLDSLIRRSPTPRWLHAWAILTVILALPLLFLGAEVTTRQVGMADNQGLRTPWHLFEVAAEKIQEGNWGFILEHSHRTFGWLTGFAVIVLALGLGLGQSRRSLRVLGVLALAAVGAQGLLGRYRVDLNAWIGRDLAFVHGCFAQLVFALLASIAYLTGSSEPLKLKRDDAGIAFRPLSFLSLALPAITYLQVVLGALTRHAQGTLGPRLHLLTAFVVAAVALYLWLESRKMANHGNPASWPLNFLVILLAVQLVLGVEAWMGRFSATGWSPAYGSVSGNSGIDRVRSLHSLVGALVFAATVVTALALRRIENPNFTQKLTPRTEGTL